MKNKMKNKNLLLVVVILSILVSSCNVMKTNTSKTLDIYGAGVVQNPVLVDLDVKDTKVEGKAEGSSSSIEAVKQDAVADAIEKANADVLVEPKYKTETSNGKTIATVTGFPATYKNFRPIREEDIKLLEAGITQKAVVHEPVKEVKPKNNRVAAIVISGLGGLLLLLLL